MRLALLALVLVAPCVAGQEDALYMIHTQEYEFLPAELSVPPGATVHAMNFGDELHTVTSSEGLFALRALRPEEPQNFTAPMTPGRYPYFCEYHEAEGMRGTLVVVANGGADTKDSPVGWLALIVATGATAALLRARRTR